MPFVQTESDVSLFYRDWGAGAPVLFCAAWALSSVAWQYQMMSVVDAGCRAVAYDRRGHGRSDDPGRGYDYDTLSDDLAAVVESLDLHDLTLVAHSMASGEVVRYLSRHGEGRVTRLLLLAPTTPFLLKTSDNPVGVDGALFGGATRGVAPGLRALDRRQRGSLFRRRSPRLLGVSTAARVDEGRHALYLPAGGHRFPTLSLADGLSNGTLTDQRADTRRARRR